MKALAPSLEQNSRSTHLDFIMNLSALPMQDRPDSEVSGHWLLARVGKKVLRPGGLELTNQMVQAADVRGKDIVELAPGLGLTAQLLTEQGPKSYTGVDEDPDATASTTEALTELTASMTAENSSAVSTTIPEIAMVTANAKSTGLPDSSVDVVFGEAMLTMHGEKAKSAIMAEAFRILRPGGKYVIHELCLEPDTLADEDKLEIRRALAKSIRVNARPLTTEEWDQLGRDAGFTVAEHHYADMALLKPKRNLQDEGIKGVLRIAFNLIRMPDARKRVLNMRSVFNKYSDHLQAIGVVLEKA